MKTIEKKDVHPLAVAVCSELQKHGHKAYIVGGCVRDLYLGLQPKDWDITTDASPEQVIAMFPRTIPTGLQHGTITVCMAEGVENHFEVTTFRVEGEYLDGRRPETVKFVGDVVEDLARRDFTINAMAYDPVIGITTDPFSGRKDLENGVIRAVGSPQARFQEDGLRIMRAARFAARFGFTIEAQTLQGMKDSKETLRMVSKERISDELCKTLMADHPYEGLSALLGVGALEIACPALVEWEVSVPLMYYGKLETRLASLYSTVPIKEVEKELLTLKMSNKEIKRVLFLLDTMEKFHQFRIEESALNYKHFMARLKNGAPDHWLDTLQQFILFSRVFGYGELTHNLLRVKYQRETVYPRKQLAISGDDLSAAGVKPGPNMKILLDACYQEILEHPEHNNKEFLLQYILTS